MQYQGTGRIPTRCSAPPQASAGCGLLHILSDLVLWELWMTLGKGRSGEELRPSWDTASHRECPDTEAQILQMISHPVSSPKIKINTGHLDTVFGPGSSRTSTSSLTPPQCWKQETVASVGHSPRRLRSRCSGVSCWAPTVTGAKSQDPEHPCLG